MATAAVAAATSLGSSLLLSTGDTCLSCRPETVSFGRQNHRSSLSLISYCGGSCRRSGLIRCGNSSFNALEHYYRCRHEFPLKTVDICTVHNHNKHCYPIYIGSGLLNNSYLLQGHVQSKKILVVTNTTVASLYLDKVISALNYENSNVTAESIILTDGEEYKNEDSVSHIHKKAFHSYMAPDSTFVALGGGVISELCGFAAATYLDGVNFVHIPTTLMAQVESPTGGEMFVHTRRGKNMPHAVSKPECVVMDTDTLYILPDRELASGIAQFMKYGLTRDADFFNWLEENIYVLLKRDSSAMAYAINRCCENKAEVVSQDEKGDGLRSTLNLGHTFAHAIESGIGHGMWLHGESVAVGMAMAVNLSFRLGWIEESVMKRTYNILRVAGLPSSPPPSTMTAEMFHSYMVVDKKVTDAVLKLVLLKGPLGNCVFTGDYDIKALDETLYAFGEGVLGTGKELPYWHLF